MSEIKIEIDAAEAGLDPDRLRRFDDYLDSLVEAGRMPGWVGIIARDGKIAHIGTGGHRDREAGLAMEADSLFRSWSLTKPFTSVAALALYEDGAFGLNDPVADYIPSLRDVRVYTRGGGANLESRPAREPIRIWHLLTHTAGFTYGFHHSHPVDELYVQRGFEWSAPPGIDLATAVDTWASLPLLFEPGTAWNYGVSTDVLGRLIEVVSGKSLDTVFAERITQPLGLHDTRFWIEPEETQRLAAIYMADPATGLAVRNDAMGGDPTQRPTWLSGSAGLLTTAADFHTFLQMLLAGGSWNGARVLSPATVRYMTTNQLPGGADLGSFGRPVLPALTTMAGLGFGFGFMTVLDPAASKVIANPGEFSWYSATSTYFFVDPVTRITALAFPQLFPSKALPLFSRLRQLVHAAVIE
ncbi:serine hydrolase domain-containing protein [Nocardia mikamii]|uniref:serine hydrolase domain-containing protein n=1 Tax=Nocardia mikamii TaxID=508464 RepID=UPI0007A3E5F3|nr:serine hydrolase domain-containing protein [Nocardia mikamii]